MADAPDRTLLESIARATSLREGPAGVEALIRAVHRAGEVRLSDAARAARLPLPVATAIRRELEKAGVLRRQAGLALTRDGRAYAEGVLGLARAHDATCSACDGRGLVVDGPLAAALEVLARHVADGPPIDVTIDQAPCTPETAILRVALMLRAGAVEGRRVLIVGDDDSVSLAIGLVGKAVAGRALTRRLTVLELDPERRAFIERVAREEAIEVEVVAHDLRGVLPPEIAGRFDVFETDPPYTLEGAELFLSRGVEALERGRGEGYLSFAHWPPRRMLELQRVWLDLGLAVKAVHPAFNAYRGAAVLGGAGQLVEFVATGAGRREAEDWRGPLYTAEVAPRERSYRCTRCRKTFHLGTGSVPATVERLKAQGCPACGNHRFERAG